jgi:hypothetical protein
VRNTVTWADNCNVRRSPSKFVGSIKIIITI